MHIVEDDDTSSEESHEKPVYFGLTVAEQLLDSTRPNLVFRGTRVGAPGSRLNCVFPCPGRWTVHIPLDGGPWRWEPGGILQLSGGTDGNR
jgi:hypothetical protein